MNRKSLPIMAIVITVAAIALFLFGLLRADFGSGTATAAVGSLTPDSYVTQYSQPGTPHLLLDVRTPEEYAEGHIANSLNISLQTLSSRLSEIPTDTPVVIYCRSGNRSAQAAQLLSEAGYTQLYDLGGIIDWQSQGYPVSNE